MPNYNESQVAGTAWQRCHTVTIRNPLAGTPVIEFAEERVITLEGDDIHQWVEGCSKQFSPTGVFLLLDPMTNAATGATMTHTQLYLALYSLYMQTAAERDTPPQEPPTP